MLNQCYIGDCMDGLREFAAAGIRAQTCVTSPPYWGLRDYGAEGQMGLEPTPEAYTARMVEVFRAVREVLADDGTLWLNLGDSYAPVNYGTNSKRRRDSAGSENSIQGRAGHWHADRDGPRSAALYAGCRDAGIKQKDMIGIPWRVAFALQADGWVLRQEIVWAKPNPMPESVRDRCTKSHEHIFMFAKARWSGAPPGRFAHISDEDARWLALCIDTEGCIVVKRVRQKDGGADSFGPQVTFGGTNCALVERFRAIVGHGNICERPGKNATMLYWQLGNNIARDFLHRIYPYLIVKPRQARIAIYVDDLVYYRGGKLPSRKRRSQAENDQLVSLWARNKECNQFGDPDLSDVPEPKYGRWSGCERYYYDADTIADPLSSDPASWGRHTSKDPGLQALRPRAMFGADRDGRDGTEWGNGQSRNRRSVWTVPNRPYPEAHFATFPTKLVEPCILAGSRPGDVVLDPFLGSGTTAQVAESLGRQWIGCEINRSYIELQKKRLQQACLQL